MRFLGAEIFHSFFRTKNVAGWNNDQRYLVPVEGRFLSRELLCFLPAWKSFKCPGFSALQSKTYHAKYNLIQYLWRKYKGAGRCVYSTVPAESCSRDAGANLGQCGIFRSSRARLV